MANTRELRRRIKSIKNTSQITRAMQMVAATKMRKAQAQVLDSRPYNQTLFYSLNLLLPKIDQDLNLLMKENSASSVGVVVLSTDKSLCGALNTNIYRFLEQFSKDKKTLYYTIGKKARGYLVKTNKSSHIHAGIPPLI